MRNREWKNQYRLGLEISKHLDPYASFEEIAKEVGTSKQHACRLCMMALGKVAEKIKREAPWL